MVSQHSVFPLLATRTKPEKEIGQRPPLLSLELRCLQLILANRYFFDATSSSRQVCDESNEEDHIVFKPSMVPAKNDEYVQAVAIMVIAGSWQGSHQPGSNKSKAAERCTPTVLPLLRESDCIATA